MFSLTERTQHLVACLQSSTRTKPATTPLSSATALANSKRRGGPKESVEALVASNPVVIYTKSFCPYCAKTKALLTELGVHFVLVGLDLFPEGETLQGALVEIIGTLFVCLV